MPNALVVRKTKNKRSQVLRPAWEIFINYVISCPVDPIGVSQYELVELKSQAWLQKLSQYSKGVTADLSKMFMARRLKMLSC